MHACRKDTIDLWDRACNDYENIFISRSTGLKLSPFRRIALARNRYDKIAHGRRTMSETYRKRAHTVYDIQYHFLCMGNEVPIPRTERTY